MSLDDEPHNLQSRGPHCTHPHACLSRSVLVGQGSFFSSAEVLNAIYRAAVQKRRSEAYRSIKDDTCAFSVRRYMTQFQIFDIKV